MSISFTNVNGDGSDIDQQGNNVPLRVNATGADEEIRTAGVNDVVNAGDGADTVIGNHGADTLRGDGGGDLLMGGGGKDVLNGGAGDDVLEGGAGNDRLFGGDGNDIINGGNGDDVLFGDNSAGAKDGTVGMDIFVFDNDDGNDKIWDFTVDVDIVHLTSGGTDADLTFSYANGNTFVSYGLTNMTFFGATLDAGDFMFV
jgi:Ca2+-binding RTX toxin-like protein